MYFKLIESKTVKLTQELVEEFKGMKPSPTERELTPSRVKHLRGKFDSDLWCPCHWVTATLDGVEYRMNGQHSSNMLSELNGNFPADAHVHIDRYKVNNIKDMALLFRQFDDRKSARTAMDVCGAYQGIEESLDGLDRKAVNLAVKGINWFRVNVQELTRYRYDDVFQILNIDEYHDFIQFFCEVYDPSESPEMAKDTIVAAMYGTYIASEESAKEFWKAVAENNSVDDTSPAQALANELDMYYQAEAKPKTKVYYGACVKAWNLHMMDKPAGLRSLRVNIKKPVPKIVGE